MRNAGSHFVIRQLVYQRRLLNSARKVLCNYEIWQINVRHVGTFITAGKALIMYDGAGGRSCMSWKANLGMRGIEGRTKMSKSGIEGRTKVGKSRKEGERREETRMQNSAA